MEPFGRPLGLGRRASAPPRRYSAHHFLSGDIDIMPNAAIASVFVMPPSTTAEAAATFCSYVYLPCFPSMRSSTSLPNARYISCHLLTASTGSERAIAADLYPCPSSKSPMAAFLASISCFTLKSTRIKKASHFSCPRNGRQFIRRSGFFRKRRRIDEFGTAGNTKLCRFTTMN